MATDQDVVDNLVEQTKEGKIKWRINAINPSTQKPEYWFSYVGANCRFLFRNSEKMQLQINMGNGAVLVDGEILGDLHNAIVSMCDVDIPSRDEALASVLDCLQQQ